MSSGSLRMSSGGTEVLCLSEGHLLSLSLQSGILIQQNSYAQLAATCTHRKVILPLWSAVLIVTEIGGCQCEIEKGVCRCLVKCCC